MQLKVAPGPSPTSMVPAVCFKKSRLLIMGTLGEYSVLPHDWKSNGPEQVTFEPA